MKNAMKKKETVSVGRRNVIKKGSYVVPAVLTLAVKPSFSSAASGSGGGVTNGARRRKRP